MRTVSAQAATVGSPSVDLAERMTWPLVDEYLVAGTSKHAAGTSVSVFVPFGFFRYGPFTEDDIERMRKAVERTWRREVRKLWERTQLASLAAKDAEIRARYEARLYPDTERTD